MRSSVGRFVRRPCLTLTNCAPLNRIGWFADGPLRAAGLLRIAHHLMTWGPTAAILAPDRLKELMWEEVEVSTGPLSQDAA